MRVTGKRKLTLPDSFPCGVRGVGDPAPSRANLMFELGITGVQWVETLTIFLFWAFDNDMPRIKRKIYWSQQ